MRASACLLLMVAATGCRERDAAEFSYFEQRKADGGAAVRVETKTSGRIIDQADALSPVEEGRLDALAVQVGRTIERQVLVLTVPPLKGQSLEQFGWAVNGQQQGGGTVLLMVRPDERIVRVESGGSVAPEQAAMVAASMQPGLRSRQLFEALRQGLGTLERVATTVPA